MLCLWCGVRIVYIFKMAIATILVITATHQRWTMRIIVHMDGERRTNE